MKKFIVLFLLFALVVFMVGTAQAASPEFVENRSFEDPDPNSANWTYEDLPEPNLWQFWRNGELADSNICYITPAHPDWYAGEPAHDGDDYVQLRLVALAVEGDEALVIQRENSAAEGLNYRTEAYARSWDTGANGVVKVVFRDADGVIIREDTATVQLSPPSVAEWTHITIDSNGPAPVGTRIVSASIANYVPNTWVDYDLISLKYTDERELTDCENSQFDPNFVGFLDADVNRDCLVNMHDFVLLAEYWAECNADLPECDYFGDFNDPPNPDL